MRFELTEEQYSELKHYSVFVGGNEGGRTYMIAEGVRYPPVGELEVLISMEHDGTDWHYFLVLNY